MTKKFPMGQYTQMLTNKLLLEKEVNGFSDELDKLKNDIHIQYSHNKDVRDTACEFIDNVIEGINNKQNPAFVKKHLTYANVKTITDMANRKTLGYNKEASILSDKENNLSCYKQLVNSCHIEDHADYMDDPALYNNIFRSKISNNEMISHENPEKIINGAINHAKTIILKTIAEDVLGIYKDFLEDTLNNRTELQQSK